MGAKIKLQAPPERGQIKPRVKAPTYTLINPQDFLIGRQLQIKRQSPVVSVQASPSAPKSETGLGSKVTIIQADGTSKKKITALNLNKVDPSKLTEEQLQQMNDMAYKQQYDPKKMEAADQPPAPNRGLGTWPMGPKQQTQGQPQLQGEFQDNEMASQSERTQKNGQSDDDVDKTE